MAASEALDVFEPGVEESSRRRLCPVEGSGFDLCDESGESLGGLTFSPDERSTRSGRPFASVPTNARNCQCPGLLSRIVPGRRCGAAMTE